jgi:hypothetical protein
MNRNSSPTDESWESDAVWQLLDQAPAPQAGPRFVDDTLRLAKLAGEEKPWWSWLLSPAPLAGVAAATAAVAFSLVSLLGPSTGNRTQTAAVDLSQAATIQEIAETETLIAAVDHLDDFSDTELVSLIGF